MTKTKKSLLLSCLSMLLCVSMLVGSTFAWFTATDSATLNEIKTGTLTIELQQNGTAVDTIAFKDADSNSLWEPGVTYTTDEVTIKNTGSLNLVYTVAVTGIVGDAKLNEVIDWTFSGDGVNASGGVVLAPGESKTFTISGHMQETADNDYQNLSITGATITVNATQTPAEKDSTTDQYDADAIDALNPRSVKTHGSGFVSYDKATNTYTIVSTAEGDYNETQGNAYVGGTIDLSEGYSSTASKMQGSKWDGSWLIETERSTGFINANNIYQFWVIPGEIVTYDFDMDGDDTYELHVVFNAMSATMPATNP